MYVYLTFAYIVNQSLSYYANFWRKLTQTESKIVNNELKKWRVVTLTFIDTIN